MLIGKKTYLAGGIMIVVAVGSCLLGDIDIPTAIQRGIEGVAIICLRLGIKLPK
jgi:hypothetical protein